jgi:hypothetical protein
MSVVPPNVVENSERLWAYAVAGVIGLVFAVIIFSSVHWAAQPPSNVETIELVACISPANLWRQTLAPRYSPTAR